MTFGEQVNMAEAFSILDLAYESGINFLDTAEMYPVPVREKTYGLAEMIIGSWFKANPNKRKTMKVATKIVGPSRGISWIRNHEFRLSNKDFELACNESLKRLQTDAIDLYQIHWPNRHVPAFGEIYFDPQKDDQDLTTMHEQLQALSKLIKDGKVKAIGLSNETPFGVHEFINLSKQYNLPRIVSVQNPYCLINRSIENALDETLHRLKVSLLAYSPLAFGLLTGKYDQSGVIGKGAPSEARLTKYESIRKQRWGRQSAFEVAALYNQLALNNGLKPVQLALAFCLKKWQVTSTILGVTSAEQLKDNLTALDLELDPDILKEIDLIRNLNRDPVQ
ncbi:aldo/keto reductase [Polynucleobacter paneuropaeus]|nr:aldo/keto reductase [Polynucleobacter paneuropaeus]